MLQRWVFLIIDPFLIALFSYWFRGVVAFLFAYPHSISRPRLESKRDFWMHLPNQPRRRLNQNQAIISIQSRTIHPLLKQMWVNYWIVIVDFGA
jgi:hypothetical protein